MFKKLLNDWLAPLIKQVAFYLIKHLFGKLMEKEPEHGKVALVALYPILDVEIEGLTEQTETEIDDAIVEGAMEAFEDLAEQYEIELPNLDED